MLRTLLDNLLPGNPEGHSARQTLCEIRRRTNEAKAGQGLAKVEHILGGQGLVA